MLSPTLLANLSAEGVVATLAYALAGGGLLVVGYVVLDLVTPGRFIERLRDDGSANAAALAVGNLIAVATVIAAAGLASPDDTANGLASMAGYGAVGIAAQAVLLLGVSARLRADIDKLLRTPGLRPLAVVVSAASVALGAITAVAVV
jgi:uncharacterized membrane protein YjfL (UPF0719 family)